MTDSTDTPRHKARNDRDTIDVALLIVAFALGAAASIGLKLFDFPVWLPALVTAVIIAVYALITYMTRSARLEPDQIGDNAYYLGFVFTLISLGYTIYELDPSADAAAVGEVISGFGIALSSTIVGVMTRVILLQYRVDLTAREGEVRMQLNDAAREFHTELADATRSTRLLGAEIRQHLEEHHKEVADAHEKRAAAMVGELIGSFKQAFEVIVELGKETNKRLADSARTAIGEGEKAAGHSLEAVARRIEETSVTLKSAMETLTEDSRQAIESSSGAHAQNMVDHERMMRESTAAMAASSDGLKTSMERLATQSREMADNMARVQSETSQRHEATMRDSAERLSAATGSFVETVAARLAEFEEKAAAAREFDTAPAKPQGSRWSWLRRSRNV